MRPLLRAASILPVAWWLGLPAPAPAFEASFLRASDAVLDNPRDLCLSADDDRLFVADGDNDRIAVLDASSLELVGSFGEGVLNGPYGLDVDAAGRLYVADSHNNRVLIFEIAGDGGLVVDEIAGGLAKPRGVAAAPDGKVYVGSAWSGEVVAFEGGKPIRVAAGLATPLDLELAPDGGVWVVESSGSRLSLLTAGLERLEEQGRGLLLAPHFLDRSEDGMLLVSEKQQHRVVAIAPSGKPLGRVGTGKPGDRPGELRMPEGVETRGGRLWIADSGNDRVVLYRLEPE
jgi:DNA-binding beta-propeller fold protein YncE